MQFLGFTLIELLVAMMFFVLLSIIGISSYNYFIKKNEQQIIIDELRTAIQYAKIQAMLRNYPVFLKPVHSSLNWSYGMTLSTRNKNTKQVELIYQWQWSHPQWSLKWVGVGVNNKIIFSNNLTEAISNGRFNLINNNTHEQITLILNRLGRIRISKNLSVEH